MMLMVQLVMMTQVSHYLFLLWRLHTRLQVSIQRQQIMRVFSVQCFSQVQGQDIFL